MPVAPDPEKIKTTLNSSFDGCGVGTGRTSGCGTTVQHTKTAFLPLTAMTDASPGTLLQPSFTQSEMDNNQLFETRFQKFQGLSPVDGDSTGLQRFLHDLNTDMTTDWESICFLAHSESGESARFSAACSP